MKLETGILISKGLCLMIIPTFTAIAAGLPELGVPVLFGLPIKVFTLGCSAVVAGAGGWLAFVSTSFSSFMSNRSGNTSFIPNPNPPKV